MGRSTHRRTLPPQDPEGAAPGTQTASRAEKLSEKRCGCSLLGVRKTRCISDGFLPVFSVSYSTSRSTSPHSQTRPAAVAHSTNVDTTTRAPSVGHLPAGSPACISVRPAPGHHLRIARHLPPDKRGTISGGGARRARWDAASPVIPSRHIGHGAPRDPYRTAGRSATFAFLAWLSPNSGRYLRCSSSGTVAAEERKSRTPAVRRPK